MREPKFYQTEGITTLLSNPKFLLADDMGLGKTFQAIRAALQTDGRRLVVCPANARGVWLRELTREGVLPTDIVTIYKGKDVVLIQDASWVIVSLPLFRDNLEAIVKRVWPLGVLILDEAHMIKDINSKSNKAITPLALRVPTFWPLTGTPIKNNYSEFFSLARILIPHQVLVRHNVHTFYKWRDEFCIVEIENIHRYNPKLRRHETIQVQKIVGSRNAVHLRELMGPYLLRRLKKNVLKDLPELRWQELFVPGIRSNATEAELAAATDAAERGKTPKGHIATRRVEWAVNAVPTVTQIVQDHVDSDPSPIIVFCNHLEPIELLAANLREKGVRVAVITGATSPLERTRIENDFQAGLYDALIGQTLAAGTAITLTKANRVLFMDLAWSPADNTQARDRAHRIGQDQEVLAQYLVSDDPLSERVTSILARKTSEIEQLETTS